MAELVRRISVYGAGSWGTALAIHLARIGHQVCLWGRAPEKVSQMAAARANLTYLPDSPFPDSLSVSANLAEAATFGETHLIVVPSNGFRSFLSDIQPHISSAEPIVWATKGIEQETGLLLHEVVIDVLGEQHPLAVISGPTFAREVAAGMPTAMTVASTERSLQDEVSALFHGDSLRMYTSSDMVGVELGGAVKNVLAIAVGISDGMAFGANARAALITRGLAEIMRLGSSMGAQDETLMGLTGLGDLVLTCTDNQSRNRRFGLAIGRGESQERTLADIGQVVEGRCTAKVVHQVAKARGVEMPICTMVYRILYQNLVLETAVSELFKRRPRSEF